MSKLPFMQFYPSDWLRDTRYISLAARGVWIDLLCALWDSPTRGSITWPRHVFAQFVGMPDDSTVDQLITELGFLGVCNYEPEDPGMLTITCRRMVRDEERRQQNVSRQSARRQQNVSNKSAQRQRDVIKKSAQRDHDKLKQESIVTASSAASNADVTRMSRPIYQKSYIRSHNKEEKTPPSAAFVLPEWIKKETWEAFEEMRKKERHPLSDGAKERIVKELAKIMAFGHDPNACLDRSIMNGWRGVFMPKENGIPPTRIIKTGAVAKIKDDEASLTPEQRQENIAKVRQLINGIGKRL